MYDAVLDAHYHQVTLYSLVLDLCDDDLCDDEATVIQARSAVENSRRMMLSTRSKLNTHRLQHGCGRHIERGPERFTRDLSL
jgi:hypothetical protein